MELKEQVAMVTGANGGIGSALVCAFLDAGVKKVYACVRKKESLSGVFADQRVHAVELDITDVSSVKAAAEAFQDVTILVNNAGANQGGLLDPQSAARAEMEVNYFGTHSMCSTFAPVLGGNGGGCIVNIISVLAMVSMPSIGTYCASKAALHSLTQGMRGALAKQGTQVIGVYPGPVATKMTEGLEMPMAAPEGVAHAVIAGVIANAEEIFPDDMAKGVRQGLVADAKTIERQFAAF